MKMDNPTTITVIGSIIAALVLAGFSFYAGNIQKRQSDADKNELLNANKTLSDSVNQKNEELAQKSDSHAQNLEIYAQKLEQFANEQKAKDKQIIDLQKQLTAEAIAQKQETEKLANLSLKLNEAQSKLNETQEKTISLASENLNYFTGGDSYCFISLTGFDEAKKNAKVRLFHYGKYPLPSIKVTITRESAIMRNAPNGGSDYRHQAMTGAHDSIFPAITLPVSPDPYELGNVPFEPKILEIYNAKFATKTRTWFQRYSIMYDEAGNRRIDSKLFIDGKEVTLGYNTPLP